MTTNYDSNDNDKGGSCNARYGVDGSNRDRVVMVVVITATNVIIKY